MSKSTAGENLVVGGAVAGISCVFIALLFVYGFIIAALWAWVLSNFWSWFVVTTFGLKAIGVAQAYGLMLVVSIFKLHLATDNDISAIMDDEKKTTDYWVMRIIGPILGAFLSYGIGYFVYTQFIL
jgi:hypothetical protein